MRVSGQLWCQTCAKDSGSPSGRYKPGSDIARIAARDQATCPHDGPRNLHGQCLQCGQIEPTEGDEPCDNHWCVHNEAPHTKDEHIDPQEHDPNSDYWHGKGQQKGQGPYEPCTDPSCKGMKEHDNLDHIVHEYGTPAARAVHDAFGGEDHGWLLDQHDKGPSKWSSKTAAPGYAPRGEDPADPTLWWRSPKGDHEVHVKPFMPARNLREDYGSKPHRDVALHHVDTSNPNSRPAIRRMDSDGDLAPVDQFSVHHPRPPLHVMKHLMDAHQHVQDTAADYADIHGQMQERTDIGNDLKAVPHHMEEEANTSRMFDNLLHKARGDDDPPPRPGIPGPRQGSLVPIVLGIVSSLRRTTASDDDFAQHFNDQMKGSEGKEVGKHLWDGMSKIFGFEDGDHMMVARQNRDHEELAKRYEGQPGKMGMDESGEPHYEIHHPSGWIGRMNVGPYMEISHKATPNETHEVLDVGQSDSNGHVLHPSMKTDDPLVNHHRAHWALHNFAKEHGDEYADNIPKIKKWQGRRGLTGQATLVTAWHDEDDEDDYKCPSCGVPGDPDDDGQHYSNCRKNEPTMDDKVDKIYDKLHPADYCHDSCRDGHANDLARGIGSHHIFAPHEREHDDPHNLPNMVAPNSQDPHAEPGYRHGNGVYEYRDPGKDARCHYCRSPLLDLSKNVPGVPSPRTSRLLEAEMNTKIALTVQKTGQRIIVVAHDSGDGETIYHCPFCGSGQIIARSDGTIDCEFCHTMFTVQVQPEYPAFPQTINGQPVQVPGMPGQIDSPVGAPADPNAPMDPSQVGAPPADGDGDGAVDADGDGEDDDFAAPASASNQPPWLKGSALVTATGARLDPEDFVAHLAIKHAPDKAAVIEQVRARRKS